MEADEFKIATCKHFYNAYLKKLQNKQQKASVLTELFKSFQIDGPHRIIPFSRESPSRFLTEQKLRQYFKDSFPSKLIEVFDQKFEPNAKKIQPTREGFWESLLTVWREENEMQKETSEQEFAHRKNLISLVIESLTYEGLHPHIQMRDKNKFKRYIVIASKSEYFEESEVYNEDCWYFLDYETLNDQVLFPFMNGKPLLVNGKFLDFKKKGVLKIYSTLYLDDEIEILASNREFSWGERYDRIYPFLLYCKDETNSLLKNPHIVTLRTKANSKNELPYIEGSYITELKKIKSKNFGVSKLIQLCEEINSAALNKNYLTLSILQRALMDYVPPIFGCKNFMEITQNYNAAGKSFREAMTKLEPARKIADLHIHINAQKNDLTPTFTQTNFSQSVDLLLSEIIKILRNSL